MLTVNYLAGREIPFFFNEDTYETIALSLDNEDVLVIPGNVDIWGLTYLAENTPATIYFIPGPLYLAGRANVDAALSYLASLRFPNLHIAYASTCTSAVHVINGKTVAFSPFWDDCRDANVLCGIYSYRGLIQDELATFMEQVTTLPDHIFAIYEPTEYEAGYVTFNEFRYKEPNLVRVEL